jgi:threonine aldolase
LSFMAKNKKLSSSWNCEKFLNGHYPISIKDQLFSLSNAVTPNETADCYGSGQLIECFEAEVASLLGKPAAIFMPSGTMAQLIAMRIWSKNRNSSKIAFHPTSHLELHEHHSYRELHGMTAELIGHISQILSLNDFEKSSGHFRAALVELPQRELGGILPSWSELVGISNYCREKNIALHLDGARLWESAPFYNKSYQELGSLFDSIYVSFYKGLGGISGAMLCGPIDFIEQAKVWQRRHGGNLFHLYPYVVSARQVMSQRLNKMILYFEKAKDIARELSKLVDIEVVPATPQTNMMHILFQRDPDLLTAAFDKIASEKQIDLFCDVKSCKDGRSKAELSVGDATLDLDTLLIAKLFEEALHLSKPGNTVNASKL